MAVLWFGCYLVYGAGVSFFPGTLGDIVGWPINMTTQILVANVSGIAGGEWKNARSQAKQAMGAGIVVLVGAIVMIGVGGS